VPTRRRAGRLHAGNGAETSSLALRLMNSPRQGFVSGMTPAHACRATCRTGIPQGEFLSVHEIGQTCPGAPEEAEMRYLRATPPCAPGSSSANRAIGISKKVRFKVGAQFLKVPRPSPG